MSTPDATARTTTHEAPSIAASIMRRAPGMSGHIVVAEGLTKLYGGVIGVNGVDLLLMPGVHGLVGPNGAGKSTLLRLCTGQIRPTSGTIQVYDRQPFREPEVFERIGYCPEAELGWLHLTAREFVTTMAHASGGSRKQAIEKAERALERVGATGFMRRRMVGYSKGMKQRVKVAQAIVHDPRLVFLDEPLDGTDPIGRREQLELFRQLAYDGVSLIISSHVLHEVQALTSSFVLMFRGRALATGTIDSIRRSLAGIPHRMTVRCDDARGLAWRMARDLPISGLDIDVATRQLSVSTHEPMQFFEQLPAVLEASGVRIIELQTDDDSLSPVFRYLLGRHDMPAR
ncbi:MAG: ABC transporter ATP-binding protein [Planctomycetota bacterium]